VTEHLIAAVGSIVPDVSRRVHPDKSPVPLDKKPNQAGVGALLSEVSHRDRFWDTNKKAADLVAGLYALIPEFKKRSQRMFDCSMLLEFVPTPDKSTGEFRLWLKSARFCRVRNCPNCSWRRSLMWRARFMKRVAVPSFPKVRWLHLTLTVENVPLNQLGVTLDKMNRAFQRMIQRKGWPALGFIKSTEVTRAKNDYAHPHFHVLICVLPSYFWEEYITKSQWISMWRVALRADYDPSIKIQAYEMKTIEENGEVRILAPAEILKYAVKSCDLIGNGKKPGLIRKGKKMDIEWLAEFTRQTDNRHFISTGGVLKDVFREETKNDDLLHPGETSSEELEELTRLWFLWREQRYRRHASGMLPE